MLLISVHFCFPCVAVVTTVLLILLYCSIIDLAVDVTGVANRRSGGYNLVRSAGLGYFYGEGGEVCRNINGDIFSPGTPHCDGEDGRRFY